MTLSLPPEAWAAAALSLRVAFWATLAGLPLALAAALALARGRFWGRPVLAAAVNLPLILPPVVTGYALLILFGRQGPLGRLLHDLFGVTVAFRWTGAALAAGVMAFPLMVRAIRLSLEAADPRLEAAAATLGAGRAAIFLLVTLPLAAPGLLAGAVLAFAKAMGEFGATITFVSNIPGETRTLASAIYVFLQTPGGEGAAAALALLSAAISVAALAGAETATRALARRLGA